MRKYRIIKKTDVLYNEKKPLRFFWYVIQKRYMTIWRDMHFDNYPDSIMNFDKLDDAKKYLKDLKEVHNER